MENDIADRVRERFLERFLEDGRKRYNAGQRGALLYYLARCLENNVPVPQWLRAEFVAAVSKALNQDVKCWDELFGLPRPKGKQHKTTQRDRKIACKVWATVQERHLRGEPLDKGLFESVGEELGLGSGLTT